ncbi:hypothetical protein ACFL7D_05120 [candidate division KSB1 bacterium]
MRIKQIFISLVLIFLYISSINAQEVQEANSLSHMPSNLIDLPVAVTYAHKEYGIGLRNYPNGGVLTNFSFGLFDKTLVAIYYGGENVIGEGDINWNPHVGFDFRLRLIDENIMLPGIIVGFSNQGYGAFVENENRYSIKSKGVYAVSSRNYSGIIGDAGLHFGANLSLENEDSDNDINLFGGANFTFKRVAEILLEYDLAVNDNESNSLGDNNGYLNLGLRFFISDNFHLTFHFKNLTENTKGKEFGREIMIEYRNIFRR